MDQVERIPRRLHLSRRTYVAVLLVAVITGAVLVYVYYSMSVASVTSLTVDEVLADRNFVSGTFPNRIATFIIEVQVWSKAQALSVRLDDLMFVVRLSGVPDVILGNETFGTGTIYPGAYLTYNLRFSMNESRNFAAISLGGNAVDLNMTTIAGAGLYSHSLTLRDYDSWNWTTATKTLDVGCADYTFNSPC
jgi:hypothetical protein